jgi:hypothetical protein
MSHLVIPEKLITPMPVRSSNDVFAQWDELTRSSESLVALPTSRPDLKGYVFLGPKGGGEPLRIGIFAGIHGDEPEGVHAMNRLVNLLQTQPDLARGYALFLYPICNPWGFEHGTRAARSGKDLNREFWQESTEPDVSWLEAELRARKFHGIISLHTDDTSDGFYGYAHGSIITENLVKPALEAASRLIPINYGAVIDGFPASQGIIRDSFPGILCAAPEVQPRPFEIILETPQNAPEHSKERALVAALRSILVEYQAMNAYAAGL